MNGGENGISNPNSYTFEDKIVLSEPTKVGYTFIGWSGTDLQSVQMEVSIDSLYGDRTYTAVWEANQYTITFDMNGGDTFEPSRIVLFDSYVSLETATKAGYTFGGWLDGNTEISSGIWKIPHDITLKALWIPKDNTKYVVNHFLENPNNNEYTLDSSEAFYGKTLSSVKPDVKKYNNFQSPSTQTLIIKADGTSTVNYYYKRDKYTLTVYPNNGEVSYTKSLKFGSTIDKQLLATRADYIVGNLYRDAEETQLQTSTMPACNINIYIRWNGETCAKEFQYEISDSKVIINKFVGPSKNVVIPAYIANCPVECISERAFQSAKCTKIVVPNTCKKIEDYAFYENNVLKEVYIPVNVENVGKSIFAQCRSLEKITLPFIGNTPYSWSPNTNITGGDTTVLGYYFGSGGYDADDAFSLITQHYRHTSNPSNYRVTVRIPNSLTTVEVLGGYIGCGTFENCSNIKTITLGKDVSYIGLFCIKGCTSLEELSIAPVGTWYKSLYQGFNPKSEIDIFSLSLTDIISLINDDGYMLRKFN